MTDQQRAEFAAKHAAATGDSPSVDRRRARSVKVRHIVRYHVRFILTGCAWWGMFDVGHAVGGTPTAVTLGLWAAGVTAMVTKAAFVFIDAIDE